MRLVGRCFGLGLGEAGGQKQEACLAGSWLLLPGLQPDQTLLAPPPGAGGDAELELQRSRPASCSSSSAA